MIAVDTNILIYAVSRGDPQGRDEQSLAVMEKIEPVFPIIPLQVIGEFLNVCRRKKLLNTFEAKLRVDEFLTGLNCPQTTAPDLLTAVDTAARYQLSYFDALIITVAARAGAALLLSEDMQDGLEVEGLRVVNPFVAANAVWIDGVIDQAS